MNSHTTSTLRNRKGSALLTTLVLVGVLSVAMVWVLKYSVTESRITHRHKLRTQCENLAEGIVEFGFAQLAFTFDNNTTVGSSAFNSGGAGALALPPQASLRSNTDYDQLELYASSVPSSGAIYLNPNEPDNMFDPLKGRYVRGFEMQVLGKATVTDPAGGPSISSYVSQTFQIRDTPLFSHAIFYNLDLEIFPGAIMDIYGPVHTNRNLYISPNVGLNFYGVTTAVEHVFHDEPIGTPSTDTGPIKFVDNTGSLLDMEVDGVWKDSDMGTGSISDTFRSYASNRWKGNLQTSAHGVPVYKQVAFDEYIPDDPATGAYDPVNTGRAIIEPPLAVGHPDYNIEVEDQKMASKAGLYFKWDTTTNTVTCRKGHGASLITNMSDLEGLLWTHKPSVMTDHRRGQTLTIIDINVGKLKQLIEAPVSGDPTQELQGYDPSTDWNGVVYFECVSSDADANAAARLNYTGIRLYGAETDVVGQGVPSRGSDPGMSFVTNNALYIRGHFNADGAVSAVSSHAPETGEVPVAVMGDSVSFLSANWNDAVTTMSPAATTTEYSLAVVGGIRPSNVQGDGTYSGGNENFPRFLENWSGQYFYIRTSMVSLFESEVDNSIWGNVSYYSPPNRAYGYNELFAAGAYPPGTPLLRTYRRANYTGLTAAEFSSQTSGL